MTSRFHRVNGAAVVLLTGALIATTAACGSNTQSTDTSKPGVPDKVTAGVIAIVDVAPIYLGKQKGFFTEKNIELTLQTATGGAAIIPLVVARQYDFGFSNVISLLLAQSRNVPVKVVANGNNSTGDPAADFGGLVVKDPAITSPKQLEGKKVATNTLNNIVDTTTKDIVQKAGGDPSKVSFVELRFPTWQARWTPARSTRSSWSSRSSPRPRPRAGSRSAPTPTSIRSCAWRSTSPRRRWPRPTRTS
jgi:NitT/TauT family transport system substrate-binding protein